MKVPLLSRCFMSTPLIFFDDAESPTGESATTMVIGCEVGSSTSVAMHKRNVFVQWRQKIFRADRDNTLAARQALGLDNNKFSEPKNVGNSASMKSSIDIDCKGLRCKTSSTQSLPPVMNNTCNRINTNRADSSSFPPISTTRRRLCSVDSSSSAMDESCSGHSILDELLMEVYKDPYEDFLQKLKSSKKMHGKIDDIEVDVLTQLPAIKSNLPPKRMRSRRNQIHHSGPSTRAILSSRSNTCQDPKAGMGKCDGESAKSALQNKLLKNGTKEYVVGNTKISGSSSVPGLRSLSSDVDANNGLFEYGNARGREGPMKFSSVRNIPIKSQVCVSHAESFHGRLEF